VSEINQSVLQCVAVCTRVYAATTFQVRRIIYVAVCCSVLQFLGCEAQSR